jgi:hypothetical protein
MESIYEINLIKIIYSAYNNNNNGGQTLLGVLGAKKHVPLPVFKLALFA